MKRALGKSEIAVNMNKLLKVKPLVDSGVLEVQDACKILNLSYHLYRKFSKEVDAMNGVKGNGNEAK